MTSWFGAGKGSELGLAVHDVAQQDDLRPFSMSAVRRMLGSEAETQSVSREARRVAMELTLTRDQASDLAEILAETLRDMSHEIAATDNAHFRAGLLDRRRRLRSIEEMVRAGLH